MNLLTCPCPPVPTKIIPTLLLFRVYTIYISTFRISWWVEAYAFSRDTHCCCCCCCIYYSIIISLVGVIFIIIIIITFPLTIHTIELRPTYNEMKIMDWQLVVSIRSHKDNYETIIPSIINIQLGSAVDVLYDCVMLVRMKQLFMSCHYQYCMSGAINNVLSNGNHTNDNDTIHDDISISIVCQVRWIMGCLMGLKRMINALPVSCCCCIIISSFLYLICTVHEQHDRYICTFQLSWWVEVHVFYLYTHCWCWCCIY